MSSTESAWMVFMIRLSKVIFRAEIKSIGLIFSGNNSHI